MRNMASLIGTGVMDRYPTLRIGTLEAGHGWLPFWMMRLDEHAENIKAALPEMKHRPSEYVMSETELTISRTAKLWRGVPGVPATRSNASDSKLLQAIQ
jgi:hypothetical protein